MKRIDGKAVKDSPFPAGGKGGVLVNVLGILLAFVIAFGGLALVQGKLTAEEARILEEGGKVEIPVHEQRLEAQEAGEAELEPAGRLSQEELVQAVKCLESRGNYNLHEPQESQLSMSMAVECAKTWMNDFFLPQLNLEPDESGEAREYRVSCFLWSREDGGEEPWLSYWSVELSSPSIDGMLIMNALTGQVMSAAVTCRSPIEYQQDGDRIDMLLEAYTDSFGIEASYAVMGQYRQDTMTFQQSRGNEAISADIRISSIAVVSADSVNSSQGYTEVEGSRDVFEYVYINLGLKMTDIANSDS